MATPLGDGGHRCCPTGADADPMRWKGSRRRTGFRFTAGRGATCAAFRLGFGSMARRGAQRTAAVVAEAVRTFGVRAVVATGWGGIAPEVESGDVLVIDQAPHDWLFPCMSAIVHHGGS